MSNVRAIQRKMKTKSRGPQPGIIDKAPARQADPPSKPPNPLAGKDYRVRRILIKCELDIYDSTGALKERGSTDELALMEADFPQPLMAYFVENGMLAEGFKTYVPPKPPETPPKE